VEDNSDCDDAMASINPDATEVCDGLDNDCDALTDDDDPSVSEGLSVFYADSDSDGLGDPATTVERCDPPPFYVSNADDCNDSSAAIGEASDWYTDGDFDGFGVGEVFTACFGSPGLAAVDGDCDDGDGDIFPGATDYCGDDIDHDCGGSDDGPGSCINLEPQDVLGTITCTEDEGAFTVEGTHIRVAYNDKGFWWDDATEAGFDMLPSARLDLERSWAAVSYPGISMDALMVELDGEGYSIGIPLPSDDFEVECAQQIAVGDVVGAIHRYKKTWTSFGPTQHLTIEKTELWNKSGEAMLVHFEVTPNFFMGSETVKIQRLMDPDIDADLATSEYESEFTHAPGDPATFASGAISDWTIGWGSCSSNGKTGGDDLPSTLWSVGEAVDLCDPDGEIGDFRIGYSTTGIASLSDPMSSAFIMTIGATMERAENEWDDEGEAMCGDYWGHWMSPALDGTCTTSGGGGGIVIPPDILIPTP
jgi:hypothetical protein